jgi:large subunit ribosomal protein L25
MLKLHAEKREQKENLQAMRADGIVPAVFYGKVQEPVSIKMKEGDFIRTYREAGESAIIILEVEGEEYEVLVHDVNIHPIITKVQHVDFYAIERGKLLTIDVPIEFTGEAPVENEGGIVAKIMHELAIEAKPRDLPQKLEVSLDSLTDMDSQILAKDIVLPEGVSLNVDENEPVVVVSAQKEEEEEDVEAVDLDSIEVEGEKKEEESTDEEK